MSDDKIQVITEVATYGGNVTPLSEEDEKKYKEDREKDKSEK